MTRSEIQTKLSNIESHLTINQRNNDSYRYTNSQNASKVIDEVRQTQKQRIGHETMLSNYAAIPSGGL